MQFRGRKSAALYKKIWTDEGSPLLVNSERCAFRLQQTLGDNCDVFVAMRYGEPSLNAVLIKLAHEHYEELLLFPLYPQFATSTTGSVLSMVDAFVKREHPPFSLKYIDAFYGDSGFLHALVTQIKKYRFHTFDHILFSFHGLPVSHVQATHKGQSCDDLSCKEVVSSKNSHCYYAQCYETGRLLASKLHLSESDYTVSFQSRFGKRWLAPHTEDVLREIARVGKKRVLVVAPSFVADCLETLHEIAIEYKELFLSEGGDELTFVESLNDSNEWVDYLKSKIESSCN